MLRRCRCMSHAAGLWQSRALGVGHPSAVSVSLSSQSERRLHTVAYRAHPSNALDVRACNYRSPAQPETYYLEESQRRRDRLNAAAKKAVFCKHCGSSSVHLATPPGESELRHVCQACGTIEYVNPKLVVGCIVEHEGHILLCRRAIQPCRGQWTIPAGFLELARTGCPMGHQCLEVLRLKSLRLRVRAGESSIAGATRETWEEASARIEVVAPYAHFDIPIIGQMYLIFRARGLTDEDGRWHHGPGDESLETKLFRPQDIPFDEVAFSSVSIALKHFSEDVQHQKFHMHYGVIDKRPGAAPNDWSAFTLNSHYTIPVIGGGL